MLDFFENSIETLIGCFFNTTCSRLCARFWFLYIEKDCTYLLPWCLCFFSLSISFIWTFLSPVCIMLVYFYSLIPPSTHSMMHFFLTIYLFIYLFIYADRQIDRQTDRHTVHFTLKTFGLSTLFIYLFIYLFIQRSSNTHYYYYYYYLSYKNRMQCRETESMSCINGFRSRSSH